MGKVIQKITAWRYPCANKFLIFDNKLRNSCSFSEIYIRVPFVLKKELEEWRCYCGKNCKPQKIKIIVEVDNAK